MPAILSLRHVPTVLRRALRTASLTAVLAVAASLAEAQVTVYVDGPNPLALDTNIGTETQPFKTINGAMVANKGPGVTILVKPGTYTEAISVPTGGGIGAPFVFRATGPGVILDGSDNFSTAGQWAAATNNEFLAAGVNWAATQVWVNGQKLLASTAAIGSLPANTFRYVAGTGLYVDIGGANPGTQTTRVSRRIGFTMSQKQYVTIDGFEIIRSNDRGINVFDGSDIVLTNNRIDSSNSYGIQFIGVLNSVIEGNRVSNAGLHGIGLIDNPTAGQSSGVTVRNNESFSNAHPTVRQANGIFLAGSPNNTISGNRLHHNQDTGLHFSALSDNCISFNNRSYANGDHGFDHLGTSNTVHMHDVAFGNFIDGFSFEGNSPGGKVFNCVSVDNGLTQSGNDLWVDTNSSVNFASGNNLIWNSTPVTPIRIGVTTYLSVADLAAVTALEHGSVGADPMFTNSAGGDFMPLAGSPLIDAAKTDIPNEPVLDAVGQVRMDALNVVNTGVGPVAFADIGALEFIPAITTDRAPIITVPGKIIALHNTTVQFTVTVSDPDADPITSLTMSARTKKNASQPSFVKNATNTSGTVSWNVGTQNGTTTFTFVARSGSTGDTATVDVQAKKAIKTGLPGPGLAAGESEFEYELIALSSGYPMPTAGAVEFSLMLPSDDQVDFDVYDAQGRRVFSESGMRNAGNVRLRWSGVDMSGRRSATGIYFAQVRVGENVFTRRIVRN